jgi:formylmethanofuran dehydrogenase subunit B
MATCTLGEVKNRADLVIYWGCNPAAEYPHHFSRYTLDAPGRWVPNGRRDRTMVLVDSRDDVGPAGADPGTAGADLVLPLASGQDLELLQVLRALVGGRRVTEAAVSATGVTLAQAAALAERMKRARFGVIFFGPRLSAGPGGWSHVAAVHALATELQQFTRFSALGMGGAGNEAANAGVLTAETGYPFAVNLSRGYPRYSPGEFTATDLLERGEVDAVVAVTADPATELSARVRAHLDRIPAIVINPHLNATSALAHVHLTTAPYGVSAEGTVYRTDEIPLPLRPVLPSPYPTDEAMLTRLCTAIEELKHA